ncbi:MAG: carbon storage regulator [Oscillospiraceae bacterium]|jgi:carbon storage regulator CsrA|nr:carbon storage regulator [Oscillospiraceae bacterium]
MLLLSVREGDYIMIGGNIKVKIIGGSSVSKIGIEAPKDISVKRQSVYERENAEADGETETAAEL